MENVTTTIDFYWRPGCPFCSMLERGLSKKNISYRKLNIWDNPDYAEFVRSVANGSETVPTVSIGGESLVNPSVRQVKALISRHAAV